MRVLLPQHILRTPLWRQLQRYIGNREGTVVWGMRSALKATGNILYLENGLLNQGLGVYIDNQGFFGNSSMVQDTSEATAAEIADLEITLKSLYPKRSYDPNGHILVCLQVNTDITLRHFFPLAGRYTDRRKQFLYHLYHNLFTDREVVIRPHPSEPEMPEFTLPSNWRVDSSGGIGEALAKASHLITINSTVATEALAFGLPVATFGGGVFDKAGVTLDCSILPACLQSLETFNPNPTNYLCKVMRHQLPYHGDYVKAFDSCIPLQKFLRSK